MSIAQQAVRNASAKIPRRSLLNQQAPSVNATAEPQEYSRAFEVLVQGDADVAGLLADAFYKQAIREAATQGRAIHVSEDRSPTATEIRAYGDAADGMLSTFTESIIEQSKTDIIDTAIRADLRRVESNLSGLIQQATTWRTAIISNLGAES